VFDFRMNLSYNIYLNGAGYAVERIEKRDRFPVL
jgi:hypothetical protein